MHEHHHHLTAILVMVVVGVNHVSIQDTCKVLMRMVLSGLCSNENDGDDKPKVDIGKW